MKPMRIKLVEPADSVPVLAIRIGDVARITGWSKPTVLRHVKFIKSYYVKMPGTNRGSRLVDYADLKNYLAKFAEGQEVQV